MKHRYLLCVAFAFFTAMTAQARDLNGDGAIDEADLQIMRAAFYSSDARADLNADGRVNFADLGLLRAARDGTGATASPAVTPTMTLLPATQDVPVFNEIVLELWMDFTAEPTVGGGTDVFYDPDALRFVAFEFDGGLGDDPAFRRLPDTTDPGLLSALAFGSFEGLTGPALVGRFTFRARAQISPTSITMAADEPDDLAGPFVSAITFLPMQVDFIGADVNVVNGPHPGIAVAPSTVSFGRVRVGQPELRRVDVFNVGDLTLSLDQAGLVNPLAPPFAILADHCSFHTLPPAQSCAITLRLFTESLVGDVSDTFSISSQGPVTLVVNVGVAGISTYPITIYATGFEQGIVRCENLASGQIVTRTTPNGALSCEGAGFEARPNAPVSVAFQGAALADGAAGGAMQGMAIRAIVCENLTTGQRVDVVPPRAVRAWNCVEDGLGVSAGDEILMSVRGRAD